MLTKESIRLFSLIFLIVYLFYDFKRDKKEFIKAKILHTLILVGFVYYYAPAFVYLGSILAKYEQKSQKFATTMGVFSPAVNQLIWWLQVVMQCFILFISWGLARRNDQSRRQLVTILPIHILIASFGFYRGFFSEGLVELDSLLVLFISFGVACVMYVPILILYNTNWMKRFFANGRPVSQETLPTNETPNLN